MKKAILILLLCMLIFAAGCSSIIIDTTNTMINALVSDVPSDTQSPAPTLKSAAIPTPSPLPTPQPSAEPSLASIKPSAAPTVVPSDAQVLQPSPQATPEPAPASASSKAHDVSGSYANDIVALVNEERASAGLPPLTVSATLSSVAKQKAINMIENDYFDHVSPSGETASDLLWANDVICTFAGENLALGTGASEQIMYGWMDSSGHRKNILSENYTQIGVGVMKNDDGKMYWVQIFTD